ncbi:MAG: glutamate racemase [Candidatus Solincola sediminis]|uniref:Glutamate racemase n=1 Tax=Candidatus Solincola sediminis TaxID=1797199 RepID=A0A1F2WPF3_9ACTN|nr:MAG: glutamate racemase [Candidatus Solincola sediminis]OFW58741.1 MAG: glutamate racemase [Candidatus Solincola sediminis]
MNDAPIGMFDSGIGGLTVMKAVMRRLPAESIYYFGDNARGPYGPRNLPEIRDFSLEIASFLEAMGVKLIVIACNSATSAGLLEVQRKCQVPVLGVVEPGARGAVQATLNRRIGVIGTIATIKSRAYLKAIRALDAGASIHSRACPSLVGFVERGEVGGTDIEEEVRRYLRPLLKRRIDTMVLGCTHYPLIHEVIADAMGDSVNVISSDEEIAREVEENLSRRGYLRSPHKTPSYRFMCSGSVEQAIRLGRLFLGPEVERVEKVDLPLPGVPA